MLVAAQKESVELAQLLLEHKANVDKESDNRTTSIHLAAYFGHATVVRLLLDECANTKFTDKWGLHPLAIAEAQEYSQVVSLFHR